MSIPNNEGKACDAVIRHLEKWTGETRAEIRFPETDNIGPPVELRLQLGVQNYAVEHTRIELFDNQIKGNIAIRQIDNYVKKRFIKPLPGLNCYYELQVPMDICLHGNRKARERLLHDLENWIQDRADCMEGRNTDRFAFKRSEIWHEDCITGTPLGSHYTIKLLRSTLWPPAFHTAGRKPGTIVLWHHHPDEEEREKRHLKRLRRAFNKKCPKLERCKEEGARTVLVLEHTNIGQTHYDIGSHLPALLAERTDMPDDIYLVGTSGDSWLVSPVKHELDHWPDVGMPLPGEVICEESKSPVAGIPKWYREALGLDDMYRIMPQKWFPRFFDPNELDNLTEHKSPKAKPK